MEKRRNIRIDATSYIGYSCSDYEGRSKFIGIDICVRGFSFEIEGDVDLLKGLSTIDLLNIDPAFDLKSLPVKSVFSSNKKTRFSVEFGDTNPFQFSILIAFMKKYIEKVAIGI